MPTPRDTKKRPSGRGSDADENDGRTYWFPLKFFGWGWGLPNCWQGWAVLVGYIALVFIGGDYFRLRGASLAVYVGTLTVALVAIIMTKGERPSDWRSGGR